MHLKGFDTFDAASKVAAISAVRREQRKRQHQHAAGRGSIASEATVSPGTPALPQLQQLPPLAATTLPTADGSPQLPRLASPSSSQRSAATQHNRQGSGGVGASHRSGPSAVIVPLPQLPARGRESQNDASSSAPVRHHNGGPFARYTLPHASATGGRLLSDEAGGALRSDRRQNTPPPNPKVSEGLAAGMVRRFKALFSAGGDDDE